MRPVPGAWRRVSQNRSLWALAVTRGPRQLSWGSRDWRFTPKFHGNCTHVGFILVHMDSDTHPVTGHFHGEGSSAPTHSRGGGGHMMDIWGCVKWTCGGCPCPLGIHTLASDAHSCLSIACEGPREAGRHTARPARSPGHSAHPAGQGKACPVLGTSWGRDFLCAFPA